MLCMFSCRNIVERYCLKMSARVWDVCDDGLYEFVSLTSDTLEGGIDVMRSSFFVDEKVCIGVELLQDGEAVVELEELNANIAMDGISLVATEKATGKVVGVAFNNLQVKAQDHQPSYFERYAARCKTPSAIAFLQFMIDADADADLFDLCKTNCVLEVASLAVLPDFRDKGIGRKLFELSVELGKALLSNKNVKTPLDGKPLPMDPVPTVVSATCTTIITQNLAKKLGFLQAGKIISYESVMFKGKSLASRIDLDTLGAVVEYKVL